jgi:hypothetical protein
METLPSGNRIQEARQMGLCLVSADGPQGVSLRLVYDRSTDYKGPRIDFPVFGRPRFDC